MTLATANDVYDFIKLLALSKKLGAYLKAIPAPDTTVIDFVGAFPFHLVSCMGICIQSKGGRVVARFS